MFGQNVKVYEDSKARKYVPHVESNSSQREKIGTRPC